MLRQVLHSKIHRACVTGAFPEYVGSITIDEDILDATGMRVSDQVVVANCREGSRVETYIFRGARGSRKIEINGAAAHLFEIGDPVIIMHYALMDEREYAEHFPKVAIMRPDNTIERVMRYEPSGR
ncbi:MAG: aspartate 1-decarboxylase [Planctomycetota bacterium]|nr:aspartate 1-decarboxylase [Planctomycetota bacterium]